MEVTYKREIKHNYLIIVPEPGAYCSYEARMIVSNCVEGLLKFHVKLIDNRQLFYYDITSMQPLGRLLEQHNISAGELKQLVVGISSTLTHMEAYLLGENQILIQPEYVYVDPENFTLGLCFVPGTDGHFTEELSELFRYILGRVDHQDKNSVVLAYGLYQESLKNNYGIQDLLKLIRPGINGSEKQNVFSDSEEILYEDPAVPPAQQRSGSNMEDLGENIFTGEEKHRSIKTKLLLVISVAIGGPSGVWMMMGNRGIKSYWLWMAALDVVVIIGVLLVFTAEFRKNQRGSIVGETASREKYERSKPAQIGKGTVGKERVVDEWKMIFTEADEEIIKKPEVTNTKQDTTLLTDLSGRIDLRHLKSQDQSVGSIPIFYYPFIIGKQEELVDYVLSQDTVSRIHLRIDHEGDNYRITDLNSTNGTMVRGCLLETNETVLLQPGDEVAIANIGFIFT